MEQDKRSINGFGSLNIDQIIKENDHFMIVYDKYPVSPGHSLIIAKRSVARYSELTKREKFDLIELIDWVVYYLENNLEPKPEGFNLGINDGISAGQTIEQFHLHVIPRSKGDMKDPRGGIRHCVENKGYY